MKLVGESLILRLRLKMSQPAPKEKRLASEIENSLRTVLKVTSLDQPYWGSVEVGEFEDGEYRFFAHAQVATDWPSIYRNGGLGCLGGRL